MDARSPVGEAFGEARLLATLSRLRESPPDDIVAAVMDEVHAFAGAGGDDRTLLVLRLW